MANRILTPDEIMDELKPYMRALRRRLRLIDAARAEGVRE